jgi:hypothetical protein
MAQVEGCTILRNVLAEVLQRGKKVTPEAKAPHAVSEGVSVRLLRLPEISAQKTGAILIRIKKKKCGLEVHTRQPGTGSADGAPC